MRKKKGFKNKNNKLLHNLLSFLLGELNVKMEINQYEILVFSLFRILLFLYQIKCIKKKKDIFCVLGNFSDRKKILTDAKSKNSFSFLKQNKC